VKFMTKVIFESTDEVGGCKNAHPEVAEGLAGGENHRGQGRDGMYPRRSWSHGARCIE
jgi:hypothetical protein